MDASGSGTDNQRTGMPQWANEVIREISYKMSKGRAMASAPKRRDRIATLKRFIDETGGVVQSCPPMPIPLELKWSEDILYYMTSYNFGGKGRKRLNLLRNVAKDMDAEELKELTCDMLKIQDMACDSGDWDRLMLTIFNSVMAAPTPASLPPLHMVIPWRKELFPQSEDESVPVWDLSVTQAFQSGLFKVNAAANSGLPDKQRLNKEGVLNKELERADTVLEACGVWQQIPWAAVELKPKRDYYSEPRKVRSYFSWPCALRMIQQTLGGLLKDKVVPFWEHYSSHWANQFTYAHGGAANLIDRIEALFADGAPEFGADWLVYGDDMLVMERRGTLLTLVVKDIRKQDLSLPKKMVFGSLLEMGRGLNLHYNLSPRWKHAFNESAPFCTMARVLTDTDYPFVINQGHRTGGGYVFYMNTCATDSIAHVAYEEWVSRVKTWQELMRYDRLDPFDEGPPSFFDVMDEVYLTFGLTLKEGPRTKLDHPFPREEFSICLEWLGMNLTLIPKEIWRLTGSPMVNPQFTKSGYAVWAWMNPEKILRGWIFVRNAPPIIPTMEDSFAKGQIASACDRNAAVGFQILGAHRAEYLSRLVQRLFSMTTPLKESIPGVPSVLPLTMGDEESEVGPDLFMPNRAEVLRIFMEPRAGAEPVQRLTNLRPVPPAAVDHLEELFRTDLALVWNKEKQPFPRTPWAELPEGSMVRFPSLPSATPTTYSIVASGKSSFPVRGPATMRKVPSENVSRKEKAHEPSLRAKRKAEKMGLSKEEKDEHRHAKRARREVRLLERAQQRVDRVPDGVETPSSVSLDPTERSMRHASSVRVRKSRWDVESVRERAEDHIQKADPPEHNPESSAKKMRRWLVQPPTLAQTFFARSEPGRFSRDFTMRICEEAAATWAGVPRTNLVQNLMLNREVYQAELEWEELERNEKADADAARAAREGPYDRNRMNDMLNEDRSWRYPDPPSDELQEESGRRWVEVYQSLRDEELEDRLNRLRQ